MRPQDNLTRAAAALARNAPQDWADFLKALGTFNEELREKLIQSPLDQLQVSQGKAQILGSLVKLLNEAVENADKIQKGTTR